MLAWGCSKSGGGDTVIMADGSIRTGRLERCTAPLCVLSGSEIPRSKILYIGLRAAMPPPTPRDPTRDEVHRTDKSIHPGPLVSVDAVNVVAASTHPREKVSWIYLAPAGVPPPGQPSPDAQAGGDSDCDRREVFLYDVFVSGKKSGSETLLPELKSEGEFAFSYDYSARYTRVPVTVKCEFGSTTISGPAGIDQKHPGSATLTSYVWRDSTAHRDPSGQKDRVPCGFNAAAAGLTAEIRIEGFVAGSGGGRPMLNVVSRLRPGEERVNTLLGARRDAVCDKGKLPNVRVFDLLAFHGEAEQFYNEASQVAGVSVPPPILSLNGEFYIDDKSVGDPEPLHALIHGESFSVSTGQKTYERAGRQSTARATTSITVVFTRSR